MKRDSRLPSPRRINSVADAQAYVNSLVGALRSMNLPAKDTVVIMQPVFTHYGAVSMGGQLTARAITDYLESGEMPADVGKPVPASFAEAVMRMIDRGKWVIAVNSRFAFPEPADVLIRRSDALDHEMTHLLVHDMFGPPYQKHGSHQFVRIGRMLFGDEFMTGK